MGMDFDKQIYSQKRHQALLCCGFSLCNCSVTKFCAVSISLSVAGARNIQAGAVIKSWGVDPLFNARLTAFTSADVRANNSNAELFL